MKNSKFIFIFIFVFVFAFSFQLPIWSGPYVLDMERWAKQGQYVAEDDVRQYDVSAAYAHPGGTLILSMIGAHKFFGASYTVETLVYVLAFLNAILVATICSLCFLLRQNLWWLGAFFALAISRMYFYATPPSAVSGLLIVLLALLTLYIHEKREQNILPALSAWALVAGLSVATRFDLGAFTAFGLLLFLFFSEISKRNLWRVAFLALNSILGFIIFNPFMWYMPFQHIADILRKALYHYADFPENTLPSYMVLDFSWLSILTFFIFCILFLNRNRFEKTSLLPIGFISTLFIMGLFLYGIFLSSSYQSVRYFIPMVLLWETILPLLLLSLPYLKPGSKNYLRWVPFGLFIVFQAGLFMAFILL